MEIDLIQLAKLLIKKAWIIILSAVICAAIAFGYSHYFLKPLYTSTSRIYINNSSVEGYENKVTASDISAAESLVNNVVAIIKSETVINAVYDDIGKELGISSPSKIKNMLDASVVTDTVMVDISIETTDPEKSQKLCESFVKVAQKRIEEIIEKSGVSVVDEPNLPEGKSFPITKNYVLVGLLIGLVLSAAIIIISDIIDSRISSAQDFEENFPDIPVIGIIPKMEEK